MRRLLALSLAFCVAAIGCERAGEKVSFPKADPIPPTALMAMIELPSGTDTSQLLAVAKTMNPQFAAFVGHLPEQVASGTTLIVESPDSIDLAGPIRTFWMDPNLAATRKVLVVRKKGKVVPVNGMVVAPITDQLVAIGDAKAVAAIDNFAAYVVSHKVKVPRAVVFPEHALADFSEELEAIVGAGAGGEVLRDFSHALVSGSERIELSVFGGKDPRVVFEMVARPGSSLATWFALQSASEFAVREKLPPLDGVDCFVSGTLHVGALGDVLVGTARRLLEAAGFDGTKAGEALAQFMEVATGDFAFAMHLDRGNGASAHTTSTVYEVTDVATAQKAYTGMFRAISGTTSRSFEHAGVGISHDAANDSAAAFFGGAAVNAGGGNAAARIRAVIDHAHGKGPGFETSAALAAAIVRAKRDRASVVMRLKFSSMNLPIPVAPVAISVIFGERSATMAFRFAR